MIKRTICLLLAALALTGLGAPSLAEGAPEGADAGTAASVSAPPETGDSGGALAASSGPAETRDALGTPKLGSAVSVASGVKITWSAVKGAAKYRVFYKTTGSWKKLADTAKTSYTWTKAKNGTKYTFTVRCLDKSGKKYASGYDKTGVSVTYLAAPKLSAVSNAATGVKITWGAVKGAAKYRVYYKTTGKWTKLADTTKTSYTWTKAKSGTKYAFTVRCMDSAGKSFASGYDDTGLSVTYVAAPKLGTAENTADGVKITWSAAKGAGKYRVFYKTTGGWKRLADTTKTSYTWTKAKAGTAYAFTVRCLDKSGKKYVSGYDSAGLTLTRLVPPTVNVSNQPNGMRATWKKAAGASEYEVYFKAKGSGGWNSLGRTTALSFDWSDAVLGMSYAFTVRAVDGGSVSAYKSSGYVVYQPATAASATDL